MKVTKVFEDDWSEGVVSNDVQYVCSTPDQAVAAIRKLNGDNKTIVELIVDEANFLTVAGGDGKYVCYGTQDDEVLLNLLTSNPSSEGLVEVVAGGQVSEFEAKFVLSLDEVVEAAHFYAINGKPNPAQEWQQQE